MEPPLFVEGAHAHLGAGRTSEEMKRRTLMRKRGTYKNCTRWEILSIRAIFRSVYTLLAEYSLLADASIRVRDEKCLSSSISTITDRFAGRPVLTFQPRGLRSIPSMLCAMAEHGFFLWPQFLVKRKRKIQSAECIGMYDDICQRLFRIRQLAGFSYC